MYVLCIGILLNKFNGDLMHNKLCAMAIIKTALARLQHTITHKKITVDKKNVKCGEYHPI